MRNGTRGSVIRNLGLGLAALVLVACGGGGGGGGGFLSDNGDGDTVEYDLDLQLFDSSGNPTSVITSSQPATFRVTVLEAAPPNDPVVAQVVSASTGFGIVEPENGQALTNDEGVAEFTIRAGDTLGADTIEVSVDSPSGTITSSLSYDIQPGGLQLGFYDGANFVPGELGLNATSIASGGTALVRFAVTDEFGDQVSSEEQVQFESACALTGDASFRLVGTTEESSRLTASTSDGLGSVEYVAGSCEGDDTIEATLLANGATASATLNVAPARANYIGFYSANPIEGSPGQIGEATRFAGEDRTILPPRGTGGPGRPEIATITFEVLQEVVRLDEGEPGPGNPAYLDNPERRPLTGVPVSFALTNDLGGITLLDDSGVTDGQGLVEVQVQSGSVATSTRVTATFERRDGTGDVSTTSNQIVIGTGLPDQDSVSLSAEVLAAAGAANIDGIPVLLTVRLADRFNNPVADGTAARFVTEYGAVDESCVTGVRDGDRVIERGDPQPPARGSCSVLWVSQAPRFPLFSTNLIKRTSGDSDTINSAGVEVDWVYDCPSHNGNSGPCPDDFGAIRGLRSTVLVTAVGEESFIDANGNGIYDDGEIFENLPEAFVDNNEDDVYTPVIGPRCGPPSTTGDCEAAGAEEEFVDRDSNGAYSLNNQGGGTFNGILCPVEGNGIYCSRELVNVRDDIVITLASSAVNQRALLVDTGFSPSRVETEAAEGENLLIYLSDVFNNAPGTGSEVTLEATDDCELISPESFIIPNFGGPGAYPISLAVSGPGSESTTGFVPSGRVNLSLADPDGDPVRIASYSCLTRCDEPVFQTNDNGTPDNPNDDFQEQTGCDE